jgi:hypothetical protein
VASSNFYVITIGFVLILLGGLTHILNDALFWYPFGLITIPFVSAWIDLVKAKIKADRVKSTQ